jgi:hypothetical protein
MMNHENPKPLPPLPSSIGDVRTVMVNGQKVTYTITDECVWPAANNREKALCIQCCVFDDGHVEIRIGYYMIDHGPKRSGCWGWRQNSAMLTQQDFKRMIAEVVKRGCLGFEDYRPQSSSRN